MKNFRTARKILAAATVVGALALTGCTAPALESPNTTQAPASTLLVADAWVKATEDGMTAGFGTVANTTDAEVTIVSATSPAAPSVELHETVMNDAGQMMMSEVDGGFVIPAGEALSLEPGGNHLMLMGVTAPLHAGDTVEFVLTLSDGSTVGFTAVVKDYAGANENYEDDGDHDKMGH